MKILMIDGDESYLNINSLWLKTVGHYEVIIASNEREAINQVKEVNPGLIIIDVNMKAGYEIVRIVRRQGHSGLIVAFAIAKEDKIIKAGCDDFVSRHIEDYEFVDKIKAIIKKNEK